jgi:putative NADH-flavin reductase
VLTAGAGQAVACLSSATWTATARHSTDLIGVVQADLTDPSSLPAALVGVSIVIDCATARPEESADKVDWEGKKALIQCAQVCYAMFPGALPVTAAMAFPNSTCD